MTSEQLKRLHAAPPFKPFQIRLADGNAVAVKHPEFMWMTPGGRTVFVSQRGDDAEIIDVLLITSLVFTGGRPRRKRT